MRQLWIDLGTNRRGSRRQRGASRRGRLARGLMPCSHSEYRVKHQDGERGDSPGSEKVKKITGGLETSQGAMLNNWDHFRKQLNGRKKIKGYETLNSPEKAGLECAVLLVESFEQRSTGSSKPHLPAQVPARRTPRLTKLLRSVGLSPAPHRPQPWCCVATAPKCVF